MVLYSENHYGLPKLNSLSTDKKESQDVSWNNEKFLNKAQDLMFLFTESVD